MRIGVGERTKTVVIFLTSRIPKSQLDMFTIDLNIGDVILEDGRDVDLRKGALGEDNEQAGLSACTVADDDQLATDVRHL